jgi:general secretion pathway protein L
MAQGGDTLPPLGRIFLCGGGSRISRLRDELAQALLAEVIALHELTVPSVPDSLQHDQGVYATCLGLGLREALGLPSPAVNLRQGTFTHQGRREVVRKELSRIGWLVAGVAAAAGVTFALEIHRLNTRYESVRQEIRRVFTTTLPEVQTIVSEKAQLRDAVETLQSRQRLFQGSTTPSPLELLRQLSAALPDQVSLDLEEWTFDTDSIRLRGSTSSFDAAETIKTTASGLGVFRDVQLKDVKAATGGKKVSFGLQLALKEQERKAPGSKE